MSRQFEIRNTKQMGRGIFALRDFEENQRILMLNTRSFITFKYMAEHPFFCKICDIFDDEPLKKVMFAFYMSFVDKHRDLEKTHSKAVIRYIDNLPKHFHNLICWNDQQLDKINNKQLITQTKNKKLRLFELYTRVKQQLTKPPQNPNQFYIPNYFQWSGSDASQDQVNDIKQDQVIQSDSTQCQEVNYREYERLSKEISFQSVLCFYSAIQSRHIHYENDHDKKSEVGALVPILELFNHSLDGQLTKDSYSLNVIRSIKKDEQIFVKYGDHSPETLLMCYGFLIDENFEKIKNQYVTSNLQYIQTQISQQRISEIRNSLAARYNKLFNANKIKEKSQIALN